MTRRRMSSLLVASSAVAVMVSAPAANAQANCQEAGVVTRCETNGSVSIKSVPGTVARPFNQPSVTWNLVPW